MKITLIASKNIGSGKPCAIGAGVAWESLTGQRLGTGDPIALTNAGYAEIDGYLTQGCMGWSFSSNHFGDRQYGGNRHIYYFRFHHP